MKVRVRVRVRVRVSFRVRVSGVLLLVGGEHADDMGAQPPALAAG